jgi:peptidoglycan L-alanyl-D-glutamate endopeptidase CwlK
MTLNTYRERCQEYLDSASPEVKVLLGRIKAQELYPEFLRLVICSLESALANGHPFYVTSGERTFDEQAKLYAYGRTDKSKGVVTTVGPGQSAHNYGIAVDAAYDLDPDKAGLQPSWEKDHLVHWADAAVANGLDAGYYWESFFDGPHVQLDIRSKGISPRKQLLQKYQKGGKLAVFQYLDTFSW